MKSYADGILVILIKILNDLSCISWEQWAFQGDNLLIQWTIQILSIWGTSIDNSVGVLDFFFFFVSICLSMCQSLCVSVHLFTVTLKFLNVSLVPGLEFKKC